VDLKVINGRRCLAVFHWLLALLLSEPFVAPDLFTG